MATIKAILNLFFAPLLIWGFLENIDDLKGWILFTIGVVWGGVQIWEKYWSKRKTRAEAKMQEMKLEAKEKDNDTVD